MKKAFLFVAIAVILWTSPVTAELFTNGGFETGDLSGWTIDYGRRSSSGYSVDWNSNGYDPIPTAGVWTASSTNTHGETLGIDINPYNGNYMARIGDSYGQYHATKITQTDTTEAGDKMLYVNWGAVLVEPTNGDHGNDRPYFSIDVSIGGTSVGSYWADSDTAGFTQIGTVPPGSANTGKLMYNNNTWSYDLSSYAIGTNVTITMIVTDCGQGGHGSYAFLDGIGSTYQPPTVPVPAAALLGLIGMAISGLKLRKFV